MPSQGVKVLLTSGVLIAAFVGLMWTTMQDGTQYYKHVDEVMVDPDAWVGKRLQVHGYASNITWKKSTLDYRFDVEKNGHVVSAEYTGIVPDTFQDESEVVVSGRLEGGRPWNRSSANLVMLNCRHYLSERADRCQPADDITFRHGSTTEVQRDSQNVRS